MSFRSIVPHVRQHGRHLCQQPCTRGYRRWVPVGDLTPWGWPGPRHLLRRGPPTFGESPSWPLAWVGPSMARMDKMFDQVFNLSPVEGFKKMMGNEMDYKYDDKDFKITLDVRDYSPEDLTVKLVDNKLIIQAKHQEQQNDLGYVSREFTQQITPPEDVDLDTLTSYVNEDGQLTVQAKVKGPKDSQERIINIEKEPKDDKKS